MTQAAGVQERLFRKAVLSRDHTLPNPIVTMDKSTACKHQDIQPNANGSPTTLQMPLQDIKTFETYFCEKMGVSYLRNTPKDCLAELQGQEQVGHELSGILLKILFNPMDRQIPISGCRECTHEDLKGLIDKLAEKHGMGDDGSNVVGASVQPGEKGTGEG